MPTEAPADPGTLEVVDLGVDLVSPVSCEWKVSSCGAEATWRGEHQCCRFSLSLCENHKKQAQDLWDNYVASSFLPVECIKCGVTPLPPYRWRKL